MPRPPFDLVEQTGLSTRLLLGGSKAVFLVPKKCLGGPQRRPVAPRSWLGGAPAQELPSGVCCLSNASLGYKSIQSIPTGEHGGSTRRPGGSMWSARKDRVSSVGSEFGGLTMLQKAIQGGLTWDRAKGLS